MNKFLKSKQLYMLFVFPFWIMASAVVKHYFSLNFSLLGGEGPGQDLNHLWQALTAGGVALGIVYGIFLISERYKLFQQTTTLPSFIYVLLISYSLYRGGDMHVLLAILVFSMAIYRLQVAINDSQNNHALFDFGMLMLSTVILCPKFIGMILWAWCATLFSGRSTLKDGVALLLGMLTPLFFLFFYCFWTDDLFLLPEWLSYALSGGGGIHYLSTTEWIHMAVLVLMFLMVSLHFFAKYTILMLAHRRMFFVFISMFFFLMLTFCFMPITYYDFGYMLAFPLAFMYAHFFLTPSVIRFGNLIFYLLLGASIWPFWM